MKILVTGDRNWSDISCVVSELQQFPSGSILVHGACKGADVTCAAVAEALGFIIRSYPADWVTYGKAAGPVRNQQMIDTENKIEEPIDVCLVFHDDLQNSRGTLDCFNRATRTNILCKIITTR